VGTATIAGASVTAPVEATGPAGQYTLHYTVIADDGDAVKGAVRFTLATAATPTSTTAATTEAQVVAPSVVAAAPTVAATPVESASSSGTSLWVWVAVGVVVVGVLGGLAGFAATRSRRGSGRGVS
jgi:hypothetical protein